MLNPSKSVLFFARVAVFCGARGKNWQVNRKRPRVALEHSALPPTAVFPAQHTTTRTRRKKKEQVRSYNKSQEGRKGLHLPRSLTPDPALRRADEERVEVFVI